MILSKNYKDINSVYDFHEGIIDSICWDNNLRDLLITVYYFFDTPKGLRDKDVIVRFKNCFSANFDYAKMMDSVKEFNIVTPHPEITEISISKSNSCITVKITTNFSDLIQISCDEIWIESPKC